MGGTLFKNFKTHKKLNLFKCPKFYRTNNCDLLIFSILLQTLLLLVTFINCSEFQLISSSVNSLSHSINPSIKDSSSSSSSSRISSNSISTNSISNPSSSSTTTTIIATNANSRRHNDADNFSANAINSANSARLIVHSRPSRDGVVTVMAGSDTLINSDSKLITRDATIQQQHLVDTDTDDNEDLDTVKFQEIIMQGLGLKTLPDASKMNISQEEYETKYNEYLNRVRERKKRELLEYYSAEYLEELLNPVTLYSIKHNLTYAQLIRAADHPSNPQDSRHWRRRRHSTISNHETVYVRFPIDFDDVDVPSDIEEATLRLLLRASRRHHTKYDQIHSNRAGEIETNESTSFKPERIVSLKVYQLIEPYGRIFLDSRQIEFDVSQDAQDSTRWIELDVSKSVISWLIAKDANLGLEIVCDGCHQQNVHIIDDASTNLEPNYSPVLNVIGRVGIHREKRSRQHHHYMQASRRKPRKTDCVQENNKCCRHKMEVIFSEIKGYDFIIQPKTFDAGYCRGRCPPRYNPAHQHAFFQSLIWKQDKNKVPRPCCAPSKLTELEVLHVDEKNKNKLQVSVWKDMRVQECACS